MKVAFITDGDTIGVICPSQFEGNKRLRLVGIDCPERKSVEGQIARDYTYSLCPPNQEIKVVLVTGDRHWGRLVGAVYIEEGIYVNELIVSAGWARAVPEFQIQTPQWERIVKAEEWAKRRKLGIWAEGANSRGSQYK
ncbi:MAG: hypothetical protein HC835_18000 [Oscillatoriales cyanobacterium RM2_1_1]|nr:hypothetical protein [Oscillatoriales cyanobacterium SM2_3_0]NJO47349.1 hypothetical protein [Oscillatoriales cyanobacterium RM2_1_1]